MTTHTTRTAINPPAPEWLSLQKAALIYDVSVDTLRRSISAGKLPASRLGTRLIRDGSPTWNGSTDPSPPLPNSPVGDSPDCAAQALTADVVRWH